MTIASPIAIAHKVLREKNFADPEAATDIILKPQPRARTALVALTRQRDRIAVLTKTAWLNRLRPKPACTDTVARCTADPHEANPERHFPVLNSIAGVTIEASLGSRI